MATAGTPEVANAEAPQDAELESFAQAFGQNWKLVVDKIEEQGGEEGTKYLQSLQKLPKTEFLQTVFDLADQIKIDDAKKTDPSFSPQSAAVQGYDKSFTLGIGGRVARNVKAAVQAPFSEQTFGEIKAAEEERSRLLEKAYPGTSGTAEVAGLFGPGTILKAVGVGKDVAVGTSAAEALFKGTGELVAKYGEKFLEKVATSPQFASRVSSIVKGGSKAVEGATVAERGTARALRAGEVGLATGAFEGAKEAVAQTESVLSGDQNIAGAAASVLEKTAEGTAGGLLFGAGFEAAGAGFGAAKRGLSKTLQKGAEIVGGKPIKYQIENVDAVRKAIAQGPENVIASSVDQVQPIVAKVQRDLQSIETSAKNELVQGLSNKKLNLTNEFKNTADEISSNIETLRQATTGNIIERAKNLNDAVGKSYGQINKVYGEEMEQIASKMTNRVDTSKALDYAENILRQNGSLTAKGQLRPETAWAQANPELFGELSSVWSRLGGEVRAKGGNPGTRSLKDAIEIKKQFGGLANFGSQPNYFEKVFRDLYREMRTASEVAAPELSAINKKYMSNRSQIDSFRSVVGRNEQMVANKLQRDLFNNKNLLVREALEGFGALSEEGAQIVGQSLNLNQRLNLINQFKKDPKGVFNQVRQAYAADDLLTQRALESASEAFPQIRVYLEKAKAQAEQLKSLPNPNQVARAAVDAEAAAQIRSALPESEQAVQRMQAARQQSQELRQVLPEDRLALERQLQNKQFGQTPIEQEVVGRVTAQSPKAAEALKQAEAGRVADTLLTGKGLEKANFEELPIIGDFIFSLRKTATPYASRALNRILKAGPQARKELASDLIDAAEGTQSIPKDQLKKMLRLYGAEATILIYGQNGGDQDILKAAEKLEKQLEE